MVLHDLNHAAHYARHLVAMAAGRIITSGTPGKVMTPQTLRAVFGVEAYIVPDPGSGVPLCIPYGLSVRTPSVQMSAILKKTNH